MRQVFIFVVSLAIAVVDGSIHAQPVIQELLGTTPPSGYLVQGSDGNYYATRATELGSVIRMTPAAEVTTIMSSEWGLYAELALGSDGNIYGTTTNGGSGPGAGYGTIFTLGPLGGSPATVFRFGATNLAPAGLRPGWDGDLYGITVGTNTGSLMPPGPVTIFKFTPGGSFTTVFAETNYYPGLRGAPVLGSDGFLYGSAGISAPGVIPSNYIYKISTNGVYQTLYTFGTNATSEELVFGADGLLYGTTSGSLSPSQQSFGTVFRVSTNGAFTNLFSFARTNGWYPVSRLLAASDGNLYGTTCLGGPSNCGTLFRITTKGDLTTLLYFTATNGSGPLSPLLESSDGNLYGTTASSSSGAGTIFRLVNPPLITGIQQTNAAMVVTWNSFTNASYRVDYTTNPANTSWSTLIYRMTSSGLAASVSDPDTNAAQRSYRVVLLP